MQHSSALPSARALLRFRSTSPGSISAAPCAHAHITMSFFLTCVSASVQICNRNSDLICKDTPLYHLHIIKPSKVLSDRVYRACMPCRKSILHAMAENDRNRPSVFMHKYSAGLQFRVQQMEGKPTLKPNTRSARMPTRGAPHAAMAPSKDRSNA